MILRKARRYASCAALVVLSLEELGKFLAHDEAFIKLISSRHRKKRNLTHKQKQRLAAEALIGVIGINEIRDLLAIEGYDLVLRPRDDTHSAYMNVIDLISSIDVDARATKPEIAKHRFVIELSQGNFDKIKQECFYVDQEESGAWTEPEKRIDRALADKMLRLASKAINSTKDRLRRFARIKERAALSGN